MGVPIATVRKLPKVWRVPQAWVAECDSHMGLMHRNVKPRLRGSGYEVWRGLHRRRARDAQMDADRHNKEHHSSDPHPESADSPIDQAGTFDATNLENRSQ